MRIILASGSPRRIDMIRGLGIEPVIIKPGCEENINLGLGPAQIVMSLALRKGLWVENSLMLQGADPAASGVAADGACLQERGDSPSRELLIAADTIVYLDGVMGKPADEEDALNMLRKLSGRSHKVFSGVYVHFLPFGEKRLLWESTEVSVKECGDQWLKSYVASGEPMDKAGGYAIQGRFAEMIERIDGSCDNVVGLPLKKILATFPEISVL